MSKVVLIPHRNYLPRETFKKQVMAAARERHWSIPQIAAATRHFGLEPLEPHAVDDFLIGKTDKVENGIRICLAVGLPISMAGRTTGLFVSTVPQYLVDALEVALAELGKIGVSSDPEVVRLVGDALDIAREYGDIAVAV